MKYIYIFIFLFHHNFSKNLKQQNKNGEDKLLFVWEHFRHGARGPYIGIDPLTNLDLIGEKWNGIGELTPLGIRMLYLLGISTKKRYVNFLSNEYNPNEIYITSTNVNRTLVSVNSFLKGFYNNKTSAHLTKAQIDRSKILNSNYSKLIKLNIKDLENNNLEGGVNIIPVHIFDKEKLEFGLYSTSNCPGIGKFRKKNMNSKQIININEEIVKYTNDTFGKYIYKFMNVSDPLYLWKKNNNYYLADTFFSNYFDGRKMKFVVNSGIDMNSFYHNSLNVTYIDTYYNVFGIPSTETVYISVSPLLRNMLKNMELRISLDKGNKPDKIISNSPRFYIISGHDTSLAPIDIFMKSEFGIDFGMATYASNQIFELWKNSTTGKYSVHNIYNFEEKGIFDFDLFKKKLLSKLYNQEEIKRICYSQLSDYVGNPQKNNSVIDNILFIIFVFISSSFIIIIIEISLIKLIHQIKLIGV